MKRSNKSSSRRAGIPSGEIELYTPERLAEFFLNNAMDKDDYLEVRKEVESMGIDPDRINHRHSPA
jgi:hypothetical protein